MKTEDKKKMCNKVFSTIFFILFISFLAIYLSQTTGYYEFEQHKKMILTKEKIDEFEKDVEEGKEIDIKDYVIRDIPNYENNVSKLGSNISKHLENFIQNGIEATFKFFNRLLQG